MRTALFTLALAFLLPVAIYAQQPSLQKLWETDTVIAVPESVLPDPANHILYVSLVDGAPWEADGKGGVGRLSPDGKQYNGTWITGLNDITVDDNGVVYVSDTKSGKVYRIAGDVPTLFMDNLEGANGLKASGKNLYILARKQVLLADPQKHLKVICDLPNGGDGVEEVGNGDLIVSEWIGNVFYVYADGRKVQILDRKPEKKNTADIWYDQKTKTLYVPGFFGKTITAYRLI